MYKKKTVSDENKAKRKKGNKVTSLLPSLVLYAFSQIVSVSVRRLAETPLYNDQCILRIE